MPPVTRYVMPASFVQILVAILIVLHALKRRLDGPIPSNEAKPFPFAVCDTSERTFTRCQLRRHCTEDSAWLLCGSTIYDATPFLKVHPGGMKSILRKSGGAADCTEDMAMHSRQANKKMKSKKVGKLVRCEREAVMDATEDQCVIS